MLLDAASAKALFAIVLASTQGADELKMQLPLQVIERGGSWLVKGTPYTDEALHTRYRMCHMFFIKQTAEVAGVNCHGRIALTKEEELHWSKILTPEQYDRAFAPDTDFEPDGIRDIWSALYGGIVVTQKAAVDYAVVLLRTSPRWTNVSSSDLIAAEYDNVWHISRRHSSTKDLITISKATGKLLSGDL